LPCTPAERSIVRHDLVVVSPEGWRAMFARHDDLAAEPLVVRWSQQGWPAVRRRAVLGEPLGVALGLPLPPSAGKKRLSLLVEDHHVESVERPPSLDAARGSAPPAWQATLDRLGELTLRHAIDARVFGSLAWQTLTGLDYVTGRSDLDLLLEVRRETDLDRLTAEVSAIEAAAPMRLDGELMRHDGAAVNWREFRAGASKVLVKHIDGVNLIDRVQFASGSAVS
jgi:phosphoribosyl-dephospho-CoA transferase